MSRLSREIGIKRKTNLLELGYPKALWLAINVMPTWLAGSSVRQHDEFATGAECSQEVLNVLCFHMLNKFAAPDQIEFFSGFTSTVYKVVDNMARGDNTVLFRANAAIDTNDPATEILKESCAMSLSATYV
jgi:hypothetical protein